MGRNDLLLEIGTEEIPASFVPKALSALKDLCQERLERSFLSFESASVLGTPRRLTLAVAGLADKQPDREEMQVGPPAKVAFGPDGSPTKAAKGFAKRHGVSVEGISVEDTERGPYAVIRKVIHGERTADLLKEIIPELIVSIPFPKTMRWEKTGFRFARPIRWIVALFGDEVIPFSIAGVQAGRETRGHRFMSPSPVKLEADSASYLSILEEKFVIPEPEKRRQIIVEEAKRAAESVGGEVLPDEDLLELNTYLTEYPSAVCGSFSPAFLDLPREVLITAMKEHQKYFAVVDKEGRLLPNFIAINNTLSPKVDLVKEGHERVLQARLSDAAFFFEEDRKQPLEAFVQELGGMVFHEKLGTLLDKTQRIQALAGSLADTFAPDQADTAKRAAHLCKADLLTEMVGEFPTLQGIMGRVYALLSGENPDVARAIEEHYLPVRSGGELPATEAGAICSIADKIDTICGTFAIGLKPSGTADPYGLRRSSLGILHILEDRAWSLSMTELIDEALDLLPEAVQMAKEDLCQEILQFFERRFVNDLTGRGFQQDVVEAAIKAGFDDPVDCLMRVRALSSVRNREEFEPLSVAFKRVMNILKDYDGGEVDPDLLEEKEEKALFKAFQSLKEKVEGILAEKDAVDRYERALVAMLSIKPFVDDFFDNVLVMAKDDKIRHNRLALLWQISRLFHRIGDLSAIVVAG